MPPNLHCSAGAASPSSLLHEERVQLGKKKERNAQLEGFFPSPPPEELSGGRGCPSWLGKPKCAPSGNAVRACWVFTGNGVTWKVGAMTDAELSGVKQVFGLEEQEHTIK